MSDVPDTPLHEEWVVAYPLNGSPQLTPLVIGDSLVVISASLDLMCVRLSTGAVKWQTRAADDVPIQSRSIVTDGTYLFTSQTSERDKDYRAYRLDTGLEVWRRPIGDGEVFDISSIAFFGAGGGAFYAGDNLGYVYAFEAATGALRWRIMPDGLQTGSAVFDRGSVYLGQGGAGGGRITKVDARDGRTVWTSRTPSGQQFFPPVLDGQTLLAFSDSLYRFDADTGRTLASFVSLGDNVPLVLSGEWVYGSASHPWKQNARTGAVAWISDYVTYGNNDVVLDDRVYHASQGALAVLDATTGALLHEEVSPGGRTLWVAVGRGLVLGLTSSRLTAYRPGQLQPGERGST